MEIRNIDKIKTVYKFLISDQVLQINVYFVICARFNIKTKIPSAEVLRVPLKLFRIKSKLTLHKNQRT